MWSVSRPRRHWRRRRPMAKREVAPTAVLCFRVASCNRNPRGFRVGHGFLVAGGALLAGAVGHELAMSGDRSDFVELRDACEAGQPCDAETLEDLQGTLQTARILSAILYGAAAASFGTGAGLLIADRPDRPSTTLLIEPAFTSRFAGISMTLRR